MNRFGVEVDATTGGSGTWCAAATGPRPILVEGDWSGAAALLALGALAGDVKVGVLSATSLQADVAMLDLLDRMGAHAESGDDVIDVHQSQLHGCSVNVSDAIDLLPVACVLAAAADGVTRLTGIARARDKESDRVASMADGLSRLGVRVEVRQDEMTIRGGDVQGWAGHLPMATIVSRWHSEFLGPSQVVLLSMGRSACQRRIRVSGTCYPVWELR